jgi:hypothetical protein
MPQKPYAEAILSFFKKKLRLKSSSPIKIVSILIFIFCIHNLFPYSAQIGLIKIYKNKDADQEILSSTQIKIAKELKTCFIAYVSSGFSSNLYHAGFRLEYLYDDIEDKKYYLVYCTSPSDVNALNDYGNARIIEENVALFWCDNIEAREILPARFELIPLSKKSLRPSKQKSLIWIQDPQPEIQTPSKTRVNTSLPQTARTELIEIYKSKEADHKILYSPKIKIVKELKTCFVAHVSSEFSSDLSTAGFNFECLDENTKDKKYYLVHCPSPSDITTLKDYGNVRIIEEDIALFWSDSKNAREILPARFELTSLPDEPLHSFKQRRLASVKSPYPERLPTSIIEVDPVILEIVDQVLTENLTGYIQNLQDFQTRYASTSQCELAGDYIHDFFVQSGLDTESDSFSFGGGYSSNNIIATLDGKVDPTQVVIICAHYDSTSNQRFTLAPGADDNASGCAAVMEAARILAPYSFDFTVKFIGFSAEEWGLYGSKDYALDAARRGEDIIAVLNVDMIAYTDLLPEDLDVISNPGSEWLADRFISTSNIYTLLDISKTVNSSFVWSDHSPFWDLGYSAILGIEDIDIQNPYYHTTDDTIDTLDLDFATLVVKAALAVASDLAQPVSTPRTPTGLNSRSQINSSLFSSRKTVSLSWDSNQDPVAGYNIYRTTTSRMNYQKINSSPVVQTDYVERDLDADTLYFYVITAVNDQSDESNYSKQVADNKGNEYVN